MSCLVVLVDDIYGGDPAIFKRKDTYPYGGRSSMPQTAKLSPRFPSSDGCKGSQETLATFHVPSWFWIMHPLP